MSEHTADIDAPRVSDRVRLWVGTEKRGGWEYGIVTALDDKGRPGISITFDRLVNGIDNCHATHAEVEVVSRVTPPGSTHDVSVTSDATPEPS